MYQESSPNWPDSLALEHDPEKWISVFGKDQSDAAPQRQDPALDVSALDMVGVRQPQRVVHISPGLPIIERVQNSIEARPGLDRALVLEFRYAAAGVVAGVAVEGHGARTVACFRRTRLGGVLVGPFAGHRIAGGGKAHSGEGAGGDRDCDDAFHGGLISASMGGRYRSL